MPAALQFGEDGGEVAARLLRADAAQRIVAAEADDDKVRRPRQPLQREGQPLQPGRGRIARDAAIDHPRRRPRRSQRPLQRGREAFVRPQPIASEQGVAEDQHEFAVRLRRESGPVLRHPGPVFLPVSGQRPA